MGGIRRRQVNLFMVLFFMVGVGRFTTVPPYSRKTRRDKRRVKTPQKPTERDPLPYK
jgi:hypothetical protein